jgi:hypothetical protein
MTQLPDVVDLPAARDLADRELQSMNFGDDIVIDDAATIEHPLAWVFLYNTKTYVRTRDVRDRFLGASPIIVERQTGIVHQTRSSHPLGFYLDVLEAHRSESPDD